MLINLATSFIQPAKLIFCSSTASVTEYSVDKDREDDRGIPEIVSHDPSNAGKLGYSRSKWVAEHICNLAARDSNANIRIARIGQLTGDMKNGIWNMKEAWPLMLSTVHQLGCLPDIDEPLSWLPLNTAAQAIIDIADSKNILEHGECPVYHVVNNCSSTTWKDLLRWLGSVKEFEIVSPSVWLDRLEGLKDHPAKQLLSLWENAYVEGQTSKQIVFSTPEAAKVSESLRSVPEVNEELVLKIWKWMEKGRLQNGEKRNE